MTGPRPRVAFSTVACPEWTLERVVRAAAEWGYDGVELRTAGLDSREFACDPGLTAAEKIAFLFSDAGVRPASLATNLSFHQPVRPRVIGHRFGDHEGPVRRAKRMIDLAARIDCPVVRVFGFEYPAGETRPTTLQNIVLRLRMVVDHAHRTGVHIAIENGGGFCRAAELHEVIERVGSHLLVASYSLAVAAAAGDDPVAGAASLGNRLAVAKIKDYLRGRPVPPGAGALPCASFARAVAAANPAAWIVCEWDRAFVPDLAPPDAVLPAAVRAVHEWLAPSQQARTGPGGVAPVSGRPRAGSGASAH